MPKNIDGAAVDGFEVRSNAACDQWEVVSYFETRDRARRERKVERMRVSTIASFPGGPVALGRAREYADLLTAVHFPETFFKPALIVEGSRVVLEIPAANAEDGKRVYRTFDKLGRAVNVTIPESGR